MQELIITTALVAMLVGTYTDLKTREVPDWLNYGLMFTGIAFNLIISIYTWDYWPILNSITGFILCLIIALIMFYSGQWGGGDSKMLMGLGGLLGLNVRSVIQSDLISFMINGIFVGALYGIFFALYLIAKHKKEFIKEIRKSMKKIAKVRIAILLATVLLIAASFVYKDTLYGFSLIALAFIMISTFYMWIIIKAVEKVCMIKKVPPSKLTEGDWIVKNIYHNKKFIAGPKDLGIEMPAIKELRKLYKQKKIGLVTIKEGIPFVPSFLGAYLLTIFVGNIVFVLL